MASESTHSQRSRYILWGVRRDQRFFPFSEIDSVSCNLKGQKILEFHGLSTLLWSLGSCAITELFYIRLQRLRTRLDFEVPSLRLHEIRVGIIPPSIVVSEVCASSLLNKVVGLRFLSLYWFLIHFFKQQIFFLLRLLQEVSFVSANSIVAKIKCTCQFFHSPDLGFEIFGCFAVANF